MKEATLTKGEHTRRAIEEAAYSLFMTQGFIENNTKPDGAYDFFNGVAGPKRAWFGMWDHVRGNDVDESGRLAMLSNSFGFGGSNVSVVLGRGWA